MALYNIRKLTQLYDKDTIRELEHRLFLLEKTNTKLKEEYVAKEKGIVERVQSFQRDVRSAPPVNSVRFPSYSTVKLTICALKSHRLILKMKTLFD